MKSEDVLFDLLEKHGARPSLSGMDWARQNWYNLQSVSDRISVLQNNARTRAGKGKSFICAVLGATLKAAVEFRDGKHSAELQTIEALQESVKVTQELVKTLQNPIVNLEEQLEREKCNSALLQMAFKELLTCKHASHTVTHSLPREKTFPQVELPGMKERRDKLEIPIAPLRPLMKTEYIFDNSEDLSSLLHCSLPPAFTLFRVCSIFFHLHAVSVRPAHDTEPKWNTCLQNKSLQNKIS